MRTALRSTAKMLPGDARAHHRAMVLQQLFHHGPASRADLARATGLTRVTVSGLVGALVEEGLVGEVGVREGRVGKPATLVGLRSQDHQVVAVDLTDDERLHGAVLDLAGTVLERRFAPVRGRTGDDAVDDLARLCEELLAAADRPVLGVGIASPGVVDDAGVVVEAPNRRWFDLPLAAVLTERLGVPAHVANDANTACLGEFTYGRAGPRGLMVVTVGEGVGAGLVLDGALVRGDGHAAGEIGHVTAVDERDEAGDAPLGRPAPCACGRRGCLETVLSVPALRRRLDGLGDDAAHDALAAVGRRLGVVLAPVVSALNLSEVVLSGPPELLDGSLRASAAATVAERTMPVIGNRVRLRTTVLGEDGALRGAAVLVLAGQLGVT